MKKIQTYTFSSVLAEREDYGRALKRMPEVSLFERCASLTKENQELKRRVSFLTWVCAVLVTSLVIAGALTSASLVHFDYRQPAHINSSSRARSTPEPIANAEKSAKE